MNSIRVFQYKTEKEERRKLFHRIKWRLFIIKILLIEGITLLLEIIKNNNKKKYLYLILK